MQSPIGKKTGDLQLNHLSGLPDIGGMPVLAVTEPAAPMANLFVQRHVLRVLAARISRSDVGVGGDRLFCC